MERERTRRKRSRIKLPIRDYKLLCIQVFDRDHWRCVVCKSRDSLHCHHVVFRSHGGDDTSSNLLSLCDTCHYYLHERYLTILPKDEIIDADKGLYTIIYVNGWQPGKKLK